MSEGEKIRPGHRPGGVCSRIVLILVALLACDPAFGQTVKLGVLSDMSGPYSDASGDGGVVAARMAVADARKEQPGLTVDLISADHLNKPDIGVTIARRWFDQEKVDAIAGLQNSAVALAVQELGRDRKKVLLISGGASSDLTGKACSPYTAHWTDDTYTLSAGTAHAMLAQGGDTWFFVTVDYAFGRSLQAEATRVIEQNGGKVVGSVLHPLNTSDFSTYLLAAQASGAKVVAFASAGGDTITEIKQAHEFGLAAHQRLTAMALLITDVNAIGLDTAQGLYLTAGFYWDRTPETRAWSHRFFDMVDRMPTREQAETYSAVLHYLRAVAATKSTDAATVMAKMKAIPVDDFYAPGATLRIDGRLIHPVYSAQVKSPAESKYPWDYYKIVGTVPPDEAFRTLEDGGCPFIKAQP